MSAYSKKEYQGTKLKQEDGDYHSQEDWYYRCDEISVSRKNSTVRLGTPRYSLKHLGYPCTVTRNSDSESVGETKYRITCLSKLNPALSTNIGLSWFKALSKEFDQKYFQELGEFLKKERSKYIIYPPAERVYSWTTRVNIYNINVVILGEEPYHGPGQDHGLAFSVPRNVTCPPSVKNIFKELKRDIPKSYIPPHGCLSGWASEGVLLMNSTLTVRADCPKSHKDSQWNHLTDAVIKWIDQNLPNSVFMLWGENAQQKMSLITKKDKHLILVAPHPSSTADRGFYGCGHFSKANQYLKQHNKRPICWSYLP